VVLARWLGPAALGLYALGWGAFRLLSLPATLGLNQGIQRFGSISRAVGGRGGARLLATTLRLTALTGGAVGVVLLVATPWLAPRLSPDPDLAPILWAFAVALPLSAILRVAAAATRVAQDLRVSVAVEDFGQPFLFAALAATSLGLGLGVVGVAVASGLSFGLTAWPAVHWARRWFPHAGPESAGKGAPIVGVSALLRYSIPTALAGTVGVTMTWLDRLLVGYYLPTEAVGWYQVAAQTSGAFAVVLGAFIAIFAPMIAGLLEKGEGERLQELYRVSTKWGVLAILPGALLCLVFAEQSIQAIFGAEFLPATAPLVILVVGQVVTAVTGAVGYVLMMGGHERLWLWLSLAALAADTVLNVILIPPFELVGAAAATTISVGVLFGAGLFLVRRKLGLWPYDRRFLGVTATAGMVFAGGAVLRTVDLGPIAMVTAAVLVASGLTLGGWRWLCFDAADRVLIDRLRRLGR
jgi:O-antigen/teichoic acid export membrane protein